MQPELLQQTSIHMENQKASRVRLQCVLSRFDAKLCDIRRQVVRMADCCWIESDSSNKTDL
jgi:hypothetical protein